MKSTTGPFLRLNALVLPALVLSAACAPVRMPSTSPDDIATIVAATQRAAPTFTPVAPATRTPRPTATISPTATPPPTSIRGTPESPLPLSLPNGATTALIEAQISPGETQSFAVRGYQGQPMLVQLESSPGDAALSMMSQGGTFFIRPGVADYWRGSLPQAGVYYLGVYGGSQPTDFRLTVTLVKRVLFKEGESKATVIGRTPNGTVSALSVFGLKGSKIILTLSGTGIEAAMSIEGFVDRKSYLDLSADKRSFTLVAPVTQDYIVKVVPDDGVTTNYIFDVEVQ